MQIILTVFEIGTTSCMGMLLGTLLNFHILVESKTQNKTKSIQREWFLIIIGSFCFFILWWQMLLNGYFRFISKTIQFYFVFHPLFITFICHFCHFVDLPRAAVRILSNMTFLFVSLSYTAESAIVTAFITFIPKFIESQFGIPASNASIYTGKALPLGLLENMIILTMKWNG